ncbi:hypothetical protein P4S81_20725 [Pseudoalteromonas sp. B28]
MKLFDSHDENKKPDIIQISLEQAAKYIENKMEVSALITKGVILCLCSVVPMFFFLAMAETNRLNLTGNIAAAIGVVCIVVMVSMGINFFSEATNMKAI